MVFDRVAPVLAEKGGELVRPGGPDVFEGIVESRARQRVRRAVQRRELRNVRLERGGRERIEHRPGVRLLRALYSLSREIGDELRAVSFPQNLRPPRHRVAVLDGLESLDAELRRDGLPAEAPSRAEAQVELHPVLARKPVEVFQDRDEPRGHEFDVLVLVSVRAVDRDDAHAAEPAFPPAAHLPGKLARFGGASEEMAYAPWPRLRRRLGERNRGGESEREHVQFVRPV